MNKPMPVGTIGWIDLTAADHELVRRFYEDVVGWTVQPVAMGGHDDYCMLPDGADEPIAGICHESGSAATGLPPVWMIYIVVADLDAALAKVEKRGGSIHGHPRNAGGMGRFAIVRDPAGAYSALFEQASTD